MTALDLIKGSLRLIGTIETGETPEAAEAQDALDILNQLLESLSLSSQGVYNIPTQQFNLVPGQSTYTIGVGGNFDTTLPVTISDAYTIQNNISYPIEIIGQERYDAIGNKTQQSTYPLYLLYQNTSPLGNVILWPTPSAVVPLVMNISAQFTQIPLTSTVITNWPQGAARMMRYLLAIDLAEEYGAPLDQAVFAKAAEAKADYMRANARPLPPMTYDGSLTNYGNKFIYANFVAGN